jgi:hypothetical protein
MIVFCFQASLDEPTHTVVMHRTEPTRLQSLALQLSEKVSSLVDNNEKIMEFKQGNYFQKNSKLFLLVARFVVVHLCPLLIICCPELKKTQYYLSLQSHLP